MYVYILHVRMRANVRVCLQYEAIGSLVCTHMYIFVNA